LSPKGGHAQPAKEGVQVQLPDASGDRADRPRLVPEVRHDARCRWKAASEDDSELREPDAPSLGEAAVLSAPLAVRRDGTDAGIRGAIQVLQVCRAGFLATPVCGGAVGPSFRKFWLSLKNRSPNHVHR